MQSANAQGVQRDPSHTIWERQLQRLDGTHAHRVVANRKEQSHLTEKAPGCERENVSTGRVEPLDVVYR
jgi:hypothetical protein